MPMMIVAEPFSSVGSVWLVLALAAVIFAYKFCVLCKKK